MTRLVVATGNRDKVREIAPLLAPAGITPVAAVELLEMWEVEETGSTLEENARIKARAAVEATGRPALADDTGLFVDALEGAPGVRSSRFSGPNATYADNVARLLEELEGVAPDGRAARFRTVVVTLRPDGAERVHQGTLEGSIRNRPRGEGGFGYDPVFALPDGRTLAELSLEEKNEISHRALAVRAAAAFLVRRQGWLSASG